MFTKIRYFIGHVCSYKPAKFSKNSPKETRDNLITVSFAFRAYVDVIKIDKGVHYIKASSNKRLKQCVHAHTLHVWSTLVAFECTDRKLLSIE